MAQRVITEDLKAIRDDIRLKVRLAQMDARDVLRELSPALKRLQRQTDLAGQAASEEISALVKKLKDAVASLRDRIERARS